MSRCLTEPTGSGSTGMATFIVRTIALSAAIDSTAFFRVGLLRAFSGESVSIGGASNFAYWSMTACASESNRIVVVPSLVSVEWNVGRRRA